MSLEDPKSDWYSASVHAIIYVISYNFGPCYNVTRLYLIFVCHCRDISWAMYCRLQRHEHYGDFSNLTVCSTVWLIAQKNQSFASLALYEGNSLVIDGFSSWRANNVESISISWWLHALPWARHQWIYSTKTHFSNLSSALKHPLYPEGSIHGTGAIHVFV